MLGLVPVALECCTVVGTAVDHRRFVVVVAAVEKEWGKGKRKVEDWQ